MRTLCLLFFGLSLPFCLSAQRTVDWPEPTPETKPWTRWWWHGSAVDSAGLSAALEAYREAGLGGVEVTAIYGVRGEEDHFLPYLGPAWMDHFSHTLEEAERLGLGVDLANASGWPFGGPWIDRAHSPKYLELKSWTLAGGQSLSEPVTALQEPVLRVAGPYRPSWSELSLPIADLPDLQQLALDQVRFERLLPLVSLMAYGDRGQTLDLTDRVRDGWLEWIAPEGQWTLYALFQGWHGKMVERAGPGGEGNVIDHFSEAATRRFLSRFDTAFAGYDLRHLRGFFNDSYEVDDARGEADWTDDFLAAFEQRRGYDLRRHLPALAGEQGDTSARVLCDYRETLSDLLLEAFTQPWDGWAEGYGKITRNQAHGSPANILDLYAAADIPEAEGTDILRAKFASSAAHVTGKPLASAEAATWLNQHFRSGPADVKAAIDRFFVAGINHIVYHGTAYSPPDADWPGRLFYAAVHFHPSNPWWRDHFSALNDYVTRCQSWLQAGRPRQDVLMYFPIHDRWSTPGEYRLQHYDGFDDIPDDWPAKILAEAMQEGGYAFDLVSDRQLDLLGVEEGRIAAPGGGYQAIVVPETRAMPLATFRRLLALSRQGATVVFQGDLPEATAGLGDYPQKDKAYADLRRSLPFEALPDGDGRRLAGEAGNLIVAPDLPAMMRAAGVRPEGMAGQGLRFIRRQVGEDVVYFIYNPGLRPFAGTVALAQARPHVARLDPMTGERGLLPVERVPGGVGVPLRLQPGESAILFTSDETLEGATYPEYLATGATFPLAGPVDLRFLRGGPVLPEPRRLEGAVPWTLLADNTDLRRFSGTAAYRFAFPRPAFAGERVELDLGEVYGSAVVYVNGEKAATLFGPDFSTTIPSDLLGESNTLDVQVTNTMANRIADMDRRGAPWKRFYNINVSSRTREDVGEDGVFSAARWSTVPGGLAGPVVLREMR